MNKTISINISGIIFNIEEEAYAILKEYLDTISGYFSDSDGKQEIMEDIEARIAELLQERTQGSQVVTANDVDEVMTIMGRPEDYLEQEEEPRTRTYSDSHSTEKKKLYLDVDRKIVAGVCAGIAAYFGWKPVWVRLIFVACAIGFWFFTLPLTALVYILLWIITPKAQTTAEKLQMHGEPVTVETIKKKVDETLKDVSEGLPNVDQNTLSGARKGVSRGVDGLLAILAALFSALGRLIGVVLLIAGVLGITALLAAALQPDAFMGKFTFSFDEMVTAVFGSTAQAVMFIAGLATQALVPLIVITLLGAALAFRPKFSFRPIGITLFLVWIVGLALLIISGIGMGTDFQVKGELEKNEILTVSDVQETYIGVLSDVGEGARAYASDSWLIDDEVLFADDDSFVSSDIDIRLRSTEADSPMRIQIYREARGKNKEVALDRAENITYEFALDSDSILLADVFQGPLSDKFRDQEVDLNIFVPIGHSVFFAPSTRKLWRYIETENDDLHLRDLMGKKWTMGEKGLYQGGPRPGIEDATAPPEEGLLENDSLPEGGPAIPSGAI